MKRLQRILTLGLLALLAACSPNPPPGSGNIEVDPPQPLSTGGGDSTSFVLENTGSTSLSWTIQIANDDDNPQDGDWFTVAPTSGTLAAGAEATVILTLRSGLEEGSYGATLSVNYPGGPTRFEVSGTVGDAPSGGFSLETDGVTNSVSPGAEVIVPIAITRTGGFSGVVALEILGAPEGLSGVFSPNPAAGDSSELTIQTDSSVAAGSYSLSARGVSGDLSDTAEVNVTVVGTTTDPAFSLALSPASLRLEPGDSASATVTVNKTASFDGSVSLSHSGAPSGVDISFDPDSTRTTSTVEVSVGDDVEPGSYAITITGESGALESSTRLGLTVPAPSSGGNGRITGTARTDAYLGDFSVPDQVTGGATALIAPDARPEYVAGQLLVKLEPVRSAQQDGMSQAEVRQNAVEALVNRYDLTLLRDAGSDELLLVEVPAGEGVLETAARLEQDPNVVYAEPNYYIYPLSIPNDPEFDQQWNLAVSGVPVAWDAKDSATNITVAVLDSGFDLSHPDLSGVFVSGYDFCGNSTCSSRDADVTPDGPPDTHGTHVAGIIAANGDNGRGVAGVLSGGARVVPVKVFYNYSFTTAERLAEAIRWAAGESVSGVPANANPAKVINMSLGTPSDSSAVRDAVAAARNRGALLVAASGNAGHTGQGVLYPAKYEGVVAVGSVNSDFQRSCFSNTGPEIDVLAAGGDGVICSGSAEAVLSTIPYGEYGALIGTSQAAPLVSGVAALIWSDDPSLSAAEVEAALEDNAYETNGLRVVRADYAFGFPRAGSSVSVSASGPSSQLDTVTLNIDGGSDSFTLENLAAGSYTVTADVGNLSASESVSLSAGESETVNLRLQP